MTKAFGVTLYNCDTCPVQVASASGEMPTGWVEEEKSDGLTHHCEACVAKPNYGLPIVASTTRSAGLSYFK